MLRNFGENRHQSSVMCDQVWKCDREGINGNVPWGFARRKKKVSLIYFLDLIKALYTLCTHRCSQLIQLITAFHVNAGWRYPGSLLEVTKLLVYSTTNIKVVPPYQVS